MTTDRAAESLRSTPVRGTASLAVCVVCALGVLETRLNALEYRSSTKTLSDDATVPSAGAVRVLALGHREWAADLLWCNALAYFGETMAQRQGQRYLQGYATTIEAVDPLFRAVYLWGGTVSVYNARRIRAESVQNSIRHLERGLRVFPDDGEMMERLGFDYYYELPPLLDDPEQKTAMKRRGAEWTRRAAALGHGPSWMALTAATELEAAGMADRAREELEAMLLRTEDENVRGRIADRLRALESDAASAGADPFLAEAERFEAERRSAYPYVAPMLYLFIGPPVSGVAGHVPTPATVSTARNAGAPAAD